MLLLEIRGEHVLLMLFSFPQFRLSCKGDNKSQILAKQVSRSRVSLFKYHLKKIVKKAKDKILNPPKTANTIAR